MKCIEYKNINKVVLVRHGQSECNQENIFTGWLDSKLTERGVHEAEVTGRVLKERNYEFDVAFTSVLSRATVTLDIILRELGQDIPVYKDWRLNERHYGDLTGLCKKETAKKFGVKQVDLWRRDFDVKPPVMTKKHPLYYRIVNNEVYRDVVDLPMGESLKMTLDRIFPYWSDVIVPCIKSGKRVLICSHGNSLRAIVGYLDKLSKDEIMKLHIPTALPFYYTVNNDMEVYESLKYIGDEEYIKNALDEVKLLSKTKYQ